MKGTYSNSLFLITFASVPLSHPIALIVYEDILAGQRFDAHGYLIDCNPRFCGVQLEVEQTGPIGSSVCLAENLLGGSALNSETPKKRW
ncbi:unnamed protein product [Dibothriocephalus latus]|uniref:Uncharacterized protein n=1 Tax=Dibothriocephalus latus TaxID=60516 RepID=A0A3P6QD08_DIBLA|nr:unnamed protein product [Dibothriocephalus latus]